MYTEKATTFIADKLIESLNELVADYLYSVGGAAEKKTCLLKKTKTVSLTTDFLAKIYTYDITTGNALTDPLYETVLAILKGSQAAKKTFEWVHNVVVSNASDTNIVLAPGDVEYSASMLEVSRAADWDAIVQRVEYAKKKLFAGHDIMLPIGVWALGEVVDSSILKKQAAAQSYLVDLGKKLLDFTAAFRSKNGIPSIEETSDDGLPEALGEVKPIPQNRPTAQLTRAVEDALKHQEMMELLGYKGRLDDKLVVWMPYPNIVPRKVYIAASLYSVDTLLRLGKVPELYDLADVDITIGSLPIDDEVFENDMPTMFLTNTQMVIKDKKTGKVEEVIAFVCLPSVKPGEELDSVWQKRWEKYHRLLGSKSPVEG